MPAWTARTDWLGKRRRDRQAGVVRGASRRATTAGLSGASPYRSARRIVRVARRQALVEPQPLDQPRGGQGEVIEGRAGPQGQVEVVHRLLEHDRQPGHPVPVLLQARARDLLAPEPVRHGAQPQGPVRRVVVDRLGAVSWPAGGLAREERVDPLIDVRDSPPASDRRSARSVPSALRASAIVSAWNAAWLPNRFAMTPRVLPSRAATALASRLANGPMATEPVCSDSASTLICSSATSTPISM